LYIDDAKYSDITPYLSVPPTAYTLNITPGNDNSLIVASYSVDLSTLGGGAAVVLASGFLDPSTNQNGAAFALIGVLADGTVIVFGNTTGIEENNASNFNMYPNPANDFVQIGFANNTSSASTLTIVNGLGQEVKRELVPSGVSSYKLTTDDLSSGIYFIKSNVGNSVTTQKLIVQ